jgi:hypothetical protein
VIFTISISINGTHTLILFRRENICRFPPSPLKKKRGDGKKMYTWEETVN